MDFSKAFKQAQQAAQQAANQLAHAVEGVVGDVGPGQEPVGQVPAPVTRKVSVIIYNPMVPSEGNRRLVDVMQWNHPDQLIPQYIQDMRDMSYGYANFQIVERLEVDRFPAKKDGFAYSGDEFVRCLRAGSGFHQPDDVDYQRILADFDIINKVNSGAIDEVWLFAFPYGGFYESTMGGPGAFWCNAPPLAGTDNARRRFVVMGYNYQRGVGEMIENYGHRAESIMQHVFRFTQGDANLWERFTRYDKTHPGLAEVGVVHFAPNSLSDYDWGNRAKVKSRAWAWLNFPSIEGEPRIVDCSEWGNGEIRAHHLWWFKHFPHITGSAHGVSFNWWKYVIDPNTVA